jgi:flagellar L-ring protein FlgH
MKLEVLSLFIVAGLLAGCSSTPPSLVTAPTHVRPQYTATVLEANPGAIYQPSKSVLLFEEPIAGRVGDELRINIAETLSSSNAANTTTSQDNSLSETGPGALSSMGGLLKEIFNYSGKASSSKSQKGTAQSTNKSSLNGNLMVTVTEVLPNNYLAVAGEKAVAASGSTTVLRFSGIVNRRDIKAGNVVSSDDVADARIEQVVDGVAAQVVSRTQLQRFLADLIDFW